MWKTVFGVFLYAEFEYSTELRCHGRRMNIPRVIRECERHEHWTALCFLYVHNDEADNAALTMMNHAHEAWEHVQVCVCVRYASCVCVL